MQALVDKLDGLEAGTRLSPKESKKFKLATLVAVLQLSARPTCHCSFSCANTKDANHWLSHQHAGNVSFAPRVLTS